MPMANALFVRLKKVTYPGSKFIIKAGGYNRDAASSEKDRGLDSLSVIFDVRRRVVYSRQ